jgi:hypothetical protein
MSSVILTGDTSGTLTVSAPLVAGSNTVTLPAATGTISLLQMGTAVASTSGTSIDFTSIPSWAKRITVMFNGVSLSGSASYLIQLGDSGGIETTGYLSTSTYSTNSASSTSGFAILSTLSTYVNSGQVVITNVSGNVWVESHSMTLGSTVSAYGGGNKTLSDVLTQVRITTTNGTDTFDAGSINVMWEG